jgi:hypothetical protein
VDTEEFAAVVLRSKSVLAQAHDPSRRIEPYRSVPLRERLHDESRLGHVSGVKRGQRLHVQRSDHIGIPN